MVKELKKDVEIKIQVTDDKSGKNIEDIYVQVRKDEYNFYVFMLNVSLNKSWDNVRISMEMDGYAEEWDCVTGKRYRIYSIQDEKIEFITSFTPNGEHIYVITKQEEDLPKRETLKEREFWNFHKVLIISSEPNAGPGHGQVSNDDGEVAGRDEILKVDRKSEIILVWSIVEVKCYSPGMPKTWDMRTRGKVDWPSNLY